MTEPNTAERAVWHKPALVPLIAAGDAAGKPIFYITETGAINGPS